jgi:acetoin utilization protein AcuB
MFVRDFMTREVFTLSPDQTCLASLRELRQRHIRRAPVLDRNRLVGIVSERDLVHILPGTPAQTSTKAGEATLDIPVKHVMTSRPKTLHPNDHLESVARLMLEHKISGIPVVQEGMLKGIITESDIVKALWRILSSETGCRVLLEKLRDIDTDLMDYVERCRRHRCRLNSLLRYPRPEGGSIYYLCIEGEKIDALIDDLWAESTKVLSVERKGPTKVISGLQTR